jgi:hypothetical protein
MTRRQWITLRSQDCTLQVSPRLRPLYVKVKRAWRSDSPDDGAYASVMFDVLWDLLPVDEFPGTQVQTYEWGNA